MEEEQMADIIQIRRDLALEWFTVNPQLASGEFSLETDTGLLKMGNGIDFYNDLPYLFVGTYSKIVLNSDGYYDLPQYYLLDNFIIQPTVDSNIKVGSTVDGDEYFFEETIYASTGKSYVINLFSNVIKRIYFSGIISSTSIVFFRKYVKQ